MILDLSMLLSKVDKVYSFNDEIVSHELNNKLVQHKIVGPIKYDGEVIKMHEGFYLTVNVNYSYETNCARCLKETKNDVKTSLSGRLEEKRVYEEVTEDRIVELDSYEETFYFDNGILDLDEYVLMEVFSSIPMRTLCNSDCKGLCKKCGTDLNLSTCDCDTDFIDPRLEKLKNLVIED